MGHIGTLPQGILSALMFMAYPALPGPTFYVRHTNICDLPPALRCLPQAMEKSHYFLQCRCCKPSLDCSQYAPKTGWASSCSSPHLQLHHLLMALVHGLLPTEGTSATISHCSGSSAPTPSSVANKFPVFFKPSKTVPSSLILWIFWWEPREHFRVLCPSIRLPSVSNFVF